MECERGERGFLRNSFYCIRGKLKVHEYTLDQACLHCTVDSQVDQMMKAGHSYTDLLGGTSC